MMMVTIEIKFDNDNSDDDEKTWQSHTINGQGGYNVILISLHHLFSGSIILTFFLFIIEWTCAHTLCILWW